MEKIEKTFCENLFKWYEKYYEGTQTKFGKFLNVSQGQIAKIFAKQRCGDETWRRMVSKKIGINYDTMIGIKKPDPENIISFESLEDEEHFNVTKKFKNKPMAIEINSSLVEIESYDPYELEEFSDIVQAKLKKLRKKYKQKTRGNNGAAASGEGQRR